MGRDRNTDAHGCNGFARICCGFGEALSRRAQSTQASLLISSAHCSGVDRIVGAAKLAAYLITEF